MARTKNTERKNITGIRTPRKQYAKTSVKTVPKTGGIKKPEIFKPERLAEIELKKIQNSTEINDQIKKKLDRIEKNHEEVKFKIDGIDDKVKILINVLKELISNLKKKK